MGKKDKGKRPRLEDKEQMEISASSSESKGEHVRYEAMPSSYKKKLYIEHVCGSEYKYVGLISWLRTMGSLDGAVFEDIGNLNLSEGSYPLVEIEVFTPEEKSAKFLICRKDLYLIAFCANGRWLQYVKCGYIIDDFRPLEGYDGRYTTKPWEYIGPKQMIDAIDVLSDVESPVPLAKCVQAAEVFIFHLCEAARFIPIERSIRKTLMPPTPCSYNIGIFRDEEPETPQTPDIYSILKGDGPIDPNHIVKTKQPIPQLIKNFSNLSKLWYVYALSGKEYCPLSDNDRSMFHIISKNRLRYSLGVLCNINLKRKVLVEWAKKADIEVYKEMVNKVEELEREKKVLGW